MTREESYKIIEGFDIFETSMSCAYLCEKVAGLIDKIFDDHEAQLKAKESDLERQDMIIKCLNIDLDNKEKLLKAKDEEIERLKKLVNAFNNTYSVGDFDFESYYAMLKDKDDEIRRLNNLYADTIKDLGDALIEIERRKEHII